MRDAVGRASGAFGVLHADRHFELLAAVLEFEIVRLS